MDATLFSFIWTHSKRRQLLLLLLTCLTFPFLYASLELPKRIVNDAIGARSSTVEVLGTTLTQVQFLLLLCVGFLLAVLIGGLLKMRINTMKGALAERLLRRLRYQLIQRMMAFPTPYFRSTSQGELVSMITSEAEPMGGLMGDAVAQPVFQLGQMLTILGFLFVQSFWFGVAACALIPLQAWLIPRLQRQINLLNKDRIQEVRHFSAEIGETAAGISDLRANGGWRQRLAQVTERLGRLYDIRFEIYRKKFFMKFLNNMIGHLTPFFFYSVGGYLAIKGQITVGALVAALAAYKDLSSPWKELLDYYNQMQDMSLRWQIVTERFAPPGMIDMRLLEGEPDRIPRLDGAIEFHNVTVRDADGNPVLEDIDLTIPPGARVAIKSRRPAERAAFAQLLTREVVPSRGQITISGRPMNTLHQAVIATRVGHAHSHPYLFDGTLGENMLMPLRIRPPSDGCHDPDRLHEARRSGNSIDPINTEWMDPSIAGLSKADDIIDWWFSLLDALGAADEILRRTLSARFDPLKHPELAQSIVALRPEVERRLTARGLADKVHRFDPETFNPSVPLAGNLLYSAPARQIPIADLQKSRMMAVLRELKLDAEATSIGQAVMETLSRTFGRDGTDHPLFRRLGLDEEPYLRLSDIAQRRARGGDAALSTEDRAMLATVPFVLTAEQIGPSFPEEYKALILRFRHTHADRLRAQMGDMFIAITPETYLPTLSVAENAIFGRVSMLAGASAGAVEQVVAEVLTERGLRRAAAAIVYDMPTGLGGANLPLTLHERTAFTRAAIKRPDILVADTVLASHDHDARVRARERLRDLLPDSIMIFMEDKFAHPEDYDLFIEIVDGRISGVANGAANRDMTPESADDLRRKHRVIAETELFGRLDPRSQRLLAFSARWYSARPGQVIFSAGEESDAVYLCLTGLAELRWPGSVPEAPPLTVIEPGRLIGDLSIITRRARDLELVACEPSTFLRIGAEEFRSVIESDAKVAMQLLETVGSHLVDAAQGRLETRQSVARLADAPGAAQDSGGVAGNA